MTRRLLCLAFCCALAQAQPSAPTALIIDLQNVVEYQADISDTSKFATNPGITPSATFRNFGAVTLIGDIVAVNGQPAKGTYIGRSRGLVASPTPAPGGAIADVVRTALREHVFEILKADGTPVGTIMSMGFSGGPAPPGTGSPSTQRANWAIVGGTGAFLGARGQVNGTGGASRAASMAEDPANRRINGGSPVRLYMHIIPMYEPHILTNASGPVIVHSNDYSPVTAAKPAAKGEILSLIASSLGPTNPDVDPGEPFPLSPLVAVNSPVEVLVNGESAQVLAAVGYPGPVGLYQINFQVPAVTEKGAATIQLNVAWIMSAPVSIFVE